jgi:hypothetical protein
MRGLAQIIKANALYAAYATGEITRDELVLAEQGKVDLTEQEAEAPAEEPKAKKEKK